MNRSEEIEWIVKKVVVEDNFILHLFFADGKEGLFDFKPYLGQKCYQKLNDEEFFKKAFVDFDSVVWPGDIDIAPEELYEKSVPVKK